MKYVRFERKDGSQGIGMIEGEEVVDLSGQYDSLGALVAAGTAGEVADRADGAERAAASSVRLLPPVDAGTQIACVAANYVAHAEEAGLKPPSEPVIFTKLVSALVGPDEAIHQPKLSEQMDYEAELGVVIGRPCRGVRAAEALDYVGGYTVVNDVTARDLQWTNLGDKPIVDWFSSKCLEKSSPLGPWIVSADEIPDPQQVQIRSWINGELRQDESTALMIHKIANLIAYVSQRIVLNPGDVIATGTPKGVGGFVNKFLQPGDRVVIDIEGVGRLENPVASAEG